MLLSSSGNEQDMLIDYSKVPNPQTCQCSIHRNSTIGAPRITRFEFNADLTVYLDYLTWDGAPDITLRRPDANSAMWKHAWVNNASQF